MKKVIPQNKVSMKMERALSVPVTIFSYTGFFQNDDFGFAVNLIQIFLQRSDRIAFRGGIRIEMTI